MLQRQQLLPTVPCRVDHTVLETCENPVFASDLTHPDASKTAAAEAENPGATSQPGIIHWEWRVVGLAKMNCFTPLAVDGKITQLICWNMLGFTGWRNHQKYRGNYYSRILDQIDINGVTVYIRSIHMGRTELYMGLWIYCHIDSGRGWTMPCNVVDTPHSTQAYGCIFWIFDQATLFLIITTTAGRTGKTCGFFYMKHHETIIISASAACLKCFRKNHPGRFSRPADKINSSWPPRSTVTAWDEQVGSHPLGFPWVYHSMIQYCTTLWWTNIAMENGHRNSGFSH